MPYMPAPIPPGAISPRAMSSSTMPPPNGVSESWKQLTEPVDVTVVDAANTEQPGVPVRTSTPSIAPFDIALGEVAPGGIGAGMYGILVLAIVTVFVAGLMVGRTPEYIGK
jgi:hypothetical protein